MLDASNSWTELGRQLRTARQVPLPRGEPFKASYDPARNEVALVPSQTGIERHVTWEEFQRFAAKHNQVEESGYDPMRPGHYQRITYNASYLVALVREFRLARHGQKSGSGRRD